MAEFGNGLADESLLDSDPGHPELEDPGVGDEEPGLEEGEAAIEDPVSRRYCTRHESSAKNGIQRGYSSVFYKSKARFGVFLSTILSHMPCALLLSPCRARPPLWFTQCSGGRGKWVVTCAFLAAILAQRRHQFLCARGSTGSVEENPGCKKKGKC